MYKAKLESMHLNPSHLQQEMIHSKAMQSSILSWTCQISDCSEHVTQCFQKSGFRDLIKKLDPIVINFNLRVEHSPVEP